MCGWLQPPASRPWIIWAVRPLRRRPLLQAATARKEQLGAQLNAIADYAEDLSRTQTQYEMLARQNAEMYHRLRVRLWGGVAMRAKVGIWWVGVGRG